MGNCFSVSLFGKLHVSREQSVIFKEYLRIFHTTQLNSSPGAETNTHSNPSSTTPGPTFQFSIAGNLGSYLSSFARDGGERSGRAWSGGGAAQNGGGKEMRGKGRVSSPWDSSSSLDSCRAGCRWWSWAYCERQSLGFRKI